MRTDKPSDKEQLLLDEMKCSKAYAIAVTLMLGFAILLTVVAIQLVKFA